MVSSNSNSFSINNFYVFNATPDSGLNSFIKVDYNDAIDIATNNGIGTVVGPNGENQATLTAAGWVFTCPTASRITITRPSGKRVQPLTAILTNGQTSSGGVNVVTKAPNGTSSAAYSAIQTYSGGAFTTLDIYALTNANTGVAAAGTASCWVTFGLIS